MKNIVIVGAGTGGTLMANKLARKLNLSEWNIIVIDPSEHHYYQPGFLFLPFQYYNEQQVVSKTKSFLPRKVQYLQTEAERLDGENKKIILKSGEEISYDFCILATGTHPRPDQTPGLTGNLWRKNIFDFYTLEGALALQKFFSTWQGGKLVMAVAEVPIKCPIAPLEFVLLADDFFTRKGIRNKVEILYATPQTGVFTKPVATAMLSNLLKERNILVETEFYIEKIDNEKKSIVSYDGREISFDCFTVVPVNMGSEFIARSGIGDDMNYVPTNKYTLQSEKYPSVFVLGDAANLPASKAGSLIHFAAETLTANLLAVMKGGQPEMKFDGHVNCFLESGKKQATLIDFSYDTEPLPGQYPLPVIGPFQLLKLTRINHWGKLIFKWLYWNFIIRARPIPIPSRFSMKGKKLVK